MRTILLVGLGGAAGTLCRYALHGYVARKAVSTFPWGTFLVNVTGCLLMGAMYRLFTAEESTVSHEHRTAIMVGVLGGFTTFSAFGVETFRLSQAGDHRTAFAYALLTNIACLAAVWIGHRVAEVWV